MVMYLNCPDGILQANIAMDEDKKEEQKKADVDRSKLEADIKAQTELASKVSVSWNTI